MAERPAVRRVSGPADAEALAGSVITTVAVLERVLGEETALLKASRIGDASVLAQAKTDAARNYVHALEAVKANGVALARWAPAAVAKLKLAQARLTAAVELNLMVLATARSVSEGIIRSLARDIAYALGTVGHVTMLRRTRAGPFTLEGAISLDKLNAFGQGAAQEDIILPIEAGLVDIPALDLSPEQARAVQQGRVLTGIAMKDGLHWARGADLRPIALVENIDGTLKTVRGFNLTP
jgi:tRNA U55 pseudouridine synthase TruB